MSHKNEESESKSWESNKSCSDEQMPMYKMPNYNPCMCCPMMYGNMSIQGESMMNMQVDPMMNMQGNPMMQGNQMMPKYGRGDSREEEEYRPMHSGQYGGQHGGQYGGQYGGQHGDQHGGQHGGQYYHHPYYHNYHPYYNPWFYNLWNYGDWSE